MGLLDTGPIKDIKIGKKTKQYWDSRECSICSAVDENGKPARLKIDKFSITNTIEDTKQYIFDLGIQLRKGEYAKHFKSHSFYLEDAKQLINSAAQRMALSRVDKLEEEFIDADEVIQDIITKGGNKLRTGEMDVDGKLLVAALKEQGTRKKMGSLQQMFTELDKKRFIVGEVVDEVKEDLPLLEETSKINDKKHVT